MSLYSEIMEQPARLEAQLKDQRAAVEDAAARLKELRFEYAFVAARGTSDNAARYANYLWGAVNHWPVALATPSLFTFYKQPPLLREALVVGISQSGQSTDIVSALEEGRRQGCPTLSITNEPSSPLAEASDFVLDIQAGAEKATAATKTYTAQLMSIAMLSTALTGSKKAWADLQKVPAWIDDSLHHEDDIRNGADRYTFINRAVVLSRGYNYSTAFEWALKMKEMTYITAEPYSSADFQHGPIAMIHSGFPVMVIAPEGKVYASISEVLKRLHTELDADMVIVSNKKEALKQAVTPIPIPAGIPEWLTPIVSIVPCQLFSYYLTAAKRFDTENPRSIRKVTDTK